MISHFSVHPVCVVRVLIFRCNSITRNTLYTEAEILVVSLKPLLTRYRSLLVKVNFNLSSGMEINFVWCLDQSEFSILRTSSNLDVDPHLK